MLLIISEVISITRLSSNKDYIRPKKNRTFERVSDNRLLKIK